MKQDMHVRQGDGSQNLGQNLSVCLIVKNEEKYLSDCLKSVQPIAKEIVIVDTGSSDRTKEIALFFRAHVYDFVWEEDFSKARNFSLAKAHGDWILVMDADELISSNDYDKLQQILNASQGQVIAYRIQTRNYTYQANTVGFRFNRDEYKEEAGVGWYPSEKVRLFPNDPRIQFEYPVHELVEPSLKKCHIPIQECPIAVHHYGPLNEANTLRKTKTYYGLGLKKKKQYSRNSTALKELAIQLSQLGQYDEALDIWKRFVKLKPRSAEAYVNMAAACWSLARYSDAIAFSGKALRLEPSLKEATFNMGFSMLMLGRAGEAKTALKRLLEKHPDYVAAQFLLCIAHACLGELTLAEGIYKKLQALPIGEFIGESFLEISKRFQAASRSDYMRLTFNAANHFGCAGQELRDQFGDSQSAA
jgi:glycosyltransferase involved in cell wall biosynthesis